MTKEELIAFTSEIKEHWEAGRIHCPWHACGGNEEQLISYFQRVKPGDWIFSTWRNNYHWLLHTGDAEFLRKKILNENNSMHIIDISRHFISSAIVSGICSMAVGTAKAIKLKDSINHIHAFVGDAGLDEGWFTEALRYSIDQNLNITWIVEDNDRSVETSVIERWGSRESFNRLLEMGKDKIFYYKYISTYKHCGTNNFVKFM